MAERVVTPMPPDASLHAVHDRELVARAAAGDAEPSEMARVRSLLADCPGCAGLDTDLRAIAAATRSFAAADAGVRAPRDLRLSVADADRLRRGGFGRRLATLLSGSRTAAGSSVRPRLATGLVALGLVGILVSTSLPGILSFWSGAAGGATSEMGADATKNLATAAPALGPAATDTHFQMFSDAPTRTGPIEPARDDAAATLLAFGLLGASIIAVAVGLGLLVSGRRSPRAGP